MENHISFFTESEEAVAGPLLTSIGAQLWHYLRLGCIYLLMKIVKYHYTYAPSPLRGEPPLLEKP